MRGPSEIRRRNSRILKIQETNPCRAHTGTNKERKAGGAPVFLRHRSSSDWSALPANIAATVGVLMTKIWSPAHDKMLWDALGDVPHVNGTLPQTDDVDRTVAALAAQLGRGNGAIRSRMRHLRDPTHAAHTALLAATVGGPRPAPGPANPLTAAISAADLPSALQIYRTGKALQLEKSANHIFTDSELEQIVARRPTERRNFASIHGVGWTKLRHYADDILTICAAHAPPQSGVPPPPTKSVSATQQTPAKRAPSVGRTPVTKKAATSSSPLPPADGFASPPALAPRAMIGASGTMASLAKLGFGGPRQAPQ